MRLIHDTAFALSVELIALVRFALTEAQSANIRHEMYHQIRAGLVRHAEQVALEDQRLHPLKGGAKS